MGLWLVDLRGFFELDTDDLFCDGLLFLSTLDREVLTLGLGGWAASLQAASLRPRSLAITDLASLTIKAAHSVSVIGGRPEMKMFLTCFLRCASSLDVKAVLVWRICSTSEVLDEARVATLTRPAS